MSGGGSTPAPTQTTTYQLSPEQRQILDSAMPSINTFAATTPTRYQGETISGFTEPQLTGQGLALDAAPGQGVLARSAANLTNSRLTTDPNSMRDQAIQAAVRPIYANLTEKALPAVRSDAVGAGQYGSSRQGIAEGEAIRDANVAAGDTAAKISSQIYGTDVDAQLKALGLVPQTQQSLLAPATTTSGVGDVQQNMNQRLLDEVVRNFGFDVNKTGDLAKAQELVALLQGLPGGSTVATGSVPPTNPYMQALGGAGAGATLGSAIMPGVGTAVGALGGALLPFLFK